MPPKSKPSPIRLDDDSIARLADAIAARIQAASASDEPASLLRWDEVRARVGMGRTTVWRRMIDGSFPMCRIIPGTKLKGWVSTEIDAWVKASRATMALS
jgi:prophage regulatory protein